MVATDGRKKRSPLSLRGGNFSRRRLSGFARVEAARRKLGVDLAPFTPLPPSPPGSHARKWGRLATEVLLAEEALYAELDAAMVDLERLALLLDVR
jgi:hypothetical protein